MTIKGGKQSRRGKKKREEANLVFPPSFYLASTATEQFLMNQNFFSFSTTLKPTYS